MTEKQSDKEMNKDKETGNFQFMKEIRKERPVNRKKVLHHVIYTVCLALLFAVVASFAMVFFMSKMKGMVAPEEKVEVTIPKDEFEKPYHQIEIEPDSHDDKQENDTQATDAMTSDEEISDGESTGQVIIQQSKDINLEQYQKLQNQLYSIGWEANRFVVSVTGVTNGTDMFSSNYEDRGKSSGLIIVNNGEDIMVMTEYKSIRRSEEIYVTFVDDTTVPAELVNYDGNTGIAVLRVHLADMTEETRERIRTADLGNSLGIGQGQLVVAVGSPQGVHHSILAGTVTSVKNTIQTIDADYTVFSTDIVGSSAGNGALLDVDGKVIGFVLQGYYTQRETNTITAVSISELKEVIEHLVNGRDIPYAGMRVSTVTEEMSEAYGIPMGVYVDEVIMDSPAMEAGFMSGDIITKVGNQELQTVQAYETAILNRKPEDEVTICYERLGADQYETLEAVVTIGVLK